MPRSPVMPPSPVIRSSSSPASFPNSRLAIVRIPPPPRLSLTMPSRYNANGDPARATRRPGGLGQAAGRQGGRVDADAEQGAGDPLGGVEQVVERAGQVRPGDRGQPGFGIPGS